MLLALQLVDSRQTTPGDVDGSSPSSPLQSFVKSPLKHDVHICLGMLLDRLRENSRLQRPVHGAHHHAIPPRALPFTEATQRPDCRNGGNLVEGCHQESLRAARPMQQLGHRQATRGSLVFLKISHPLPGPLCHITGVWQARAAGRRFIGGALPRRLDGGAIGRIAAQLPWPICHGRWGWFPETPAHVEKHMHGTFVTCHLTTIYDDRWRWRELQSEATTVWDVCTMARQTTKTGIRAAFGNYDKKLSYGKSKFEFRREGKNKKLLENC